MDEITTQSSIKQVRDLLAEQYNFPTGMSTSHIIRRAGYFFDDINDTMRELRIYGRKHPDVIKLCVDLANYFVACGDLHFSNDKNATTTVDQMLRLASQSLNGIEHSLQTKFDDKYQEYHWHGW
jgi:hypothetical protein